MYQKWKARFLEEFGHPAQAIFAAPGRTELSGNHTDHQHGCVLAAAVELRAVAAVAENGSDVIRVHSEGYAPCEVSLRELRPRAEEAGTTTSLIRGTAAGFAAQGCALRGFDAYVTSEVLSGSGLSSSAAFEILLGTVCNHLFFDARLTPVQIAQLGQAAENAFFGKPCGLMDQTACAVGNCVGIDFSDPSNPVVTPIAFDFSASGYALCIIDSGADHADLTADYAAIPADMKAVARACGKEVLNDVPESEFYARLTALRAELGEQPCLRAMHFFEENKRVRRQIEALTRGDFATFLREVNASGSSSWRLLQNVVPANGNHALAFALARAETLLGGRGACRVHGGGFAGTLQAFVPVELLEEFRTGMEATLGAGSCHVLSVCKEGGKLLEVCR